jgi:hypothetical protein
MTTHQPNGQQQPDVLHRRVDDLEERMDRNEEAFQTVIRKLDEAAIGHRHILRSLGKIEAAIKALGTR